LKYLHACKLVIETVRNATVDTKIDDILVIGREVKEVSRRDQLCVLLRNEKFHDSTIHCVVRWATIESEGPDSEFFDMKEGGETAVFNSITAVARESDDMLREY